MSEFVTQLSRVGNDAMHGEEGSKTDQTGVGMEVHARPLRTAQLIPL
jgi:hypothetical protein